MLVSPEIFFIADSTPGRKNDSPDDFRAYQDTPAPVKGARAGLRDFFCSFQQNRGTPDGAFCSLHRTK